MKNIGIFFNGPQEWYQNVFNSFNKHKRTWLQQSKIPKEEYLKILKQIISEQGFIYGFGYVQLPVTKVIWRMKITKFVTSYNRIPAPDETAPVFSEYDITQGGCQSSDFSYPMWLQVESMERISPIDKSFFVNINNNNPVQSVRGNPNYIVEIPIELTENDSDIISETPNIIVQRKQQPEILALESEIGISLGVEKDLQRFLSLNLSSLEKGLTLYEQGTEYAVSTGRIDLFCTDINKDFVVIELKAGKAGLDAYGQIKSYIAALRYDKEITNKIRGFIIARDFDDRLILTVENDPEISLFYYNVKFDFNSATMK